MPNYNVTYTISTTTTTVRTETAERIIRADSFSQAVTFANDLDYQAPGFVVESSDESVGSVTLIALDGVEAASAAAPPVPVVRDLGLPAAEYDPEPAPDGSDYNFIQVEPTPRVG